MLSIFFPFFDRKFWWLKIMATIEELAHQIFEQQMGEVH